MSSFLRNLAFLVLLGVALFVLFPGILKNVLGMYNGLGLLPIILILVILAALPRNARRRR